MTWHHKGGKSWQLGILKIKTLCYTDWEKTLGSCIFHEGLLSTVYKELSKLNSKINDPIGKWQKTRTDRHLVEEEMWMAKEHTKKCAPPPPIREMRTETVRRCHCTPVSTDKWKTVTAQVLERTWRSCTLPVGMWMGQPLRKAVWPFLQKINTRLLYDPAAVLLGICPRKTETCVYQKTIYNCS